MDHLLHRCSTRALKGLQRIPESVVHSTRVLGGTYCQRRGAKFNGANDFRRTNPRELTRDNSGDTEGGTVRSLWDAAQDYKKHEAMKFSPIRRFRNEKMAEPTQASNMKVSEQGHPDAHVEYIRIGNWDPFHPVFLRDSCTCEKCVNPSSTQKNFQTTDIPKNIKAGSLDVSPEGIVEIVWENDIPGFEPGHKSIFSPKFFEVHSSPSNLHKSLCENVRPRLWDKETITRELEYVNYEDYMNTDQGLFRAVGQVSRYPKSLKQGEQLLTPHFNSYTYMAYYSFEAYRNPKNQSKT